MDQLPEHLGGQVRGNIDVALMGYINSTFPDIKSVIDVGCGDGKAALTYEKEFDFYCFGFDGDWLRLPKNENFILHGKVRIKWEGTDKTNLH